VNVGGTLKYEGRTGAAADAGDYGLFAARGVKVELYFPPGTLFDTTYANDAGVYQFAKPIPAPDAAATAKIKVFTESKPNFAGAEVLKITNVAGTETYAWESPAVNVLTPAGGFNHDFKDRATLDYAFATHDMYITPMRYTNNLTLSGSGATPFSVPVKFPIPGDSTFYDGTTEQVSHLEGDRFDWDVAGHEYGHGVAKKNGFQQGVGGFHSAAANLRFERGPGSMATTGAPDYDFKQTSQLAFGEGFATYFSLVAQRVIGTPGNQRSNDTLYHDNDDANGTGLGTAASIETNGAAFTSLGEDSEGSVQRILWDLYDNANEAADRDRVTLGHAAVWNKINTNNVVTLNQFWGELETGASVKNKIDYGAIFEAHNVSPQPDDATAPVIVDERDPSPKFIWKNPIGRATATAALEKELLDSFTVLFFDSLFNQIPVGSDIIKDTAINNLTNELSYSLDAGQMGLLWESIGIATGSGTVYWVVTGGNKDFDGTAANFETGMYWSDARSFVMVPEPASISALLALGMLVRRNRK